jgi:hypothetical protein
MNLYRMFKRLQNIDKLRKIESKRQWNACRKDVGIFF